MTQEVEKRKKRTRSIESYAKQAGISKKRAVKNHASKTTFVGSPLITKLWAKMNELGETSCEHHYQMGQLAKKLGISKIFCHGQFASSYIDGFGSAQQQFTDKESLFAAFVSSVIKSPDSSATLVLVKGSGKTKTSLIADWLREGKAPTSQNYR